MVCRLYDGENDNPNELNVVAQPNGRVSLGIEDRDSGDDELWITVSRAELLAALALTDAQCVSVDAPDKGQWMNPDATIPHRSA
jgi:hypothetical protein